jgi:hypothetical protein
VRRISRGPDPAPAFQNLTLGSTNGLTLVTTCCNTRNWPTTDTVFASGTMVVRSNLQLMVLTAEQDWTAWVTSVTTGLPVAGAEVQIYTSQYGVGEGGSAEGVLFSMCSFTYRSAGSVSCVSSPPNHDVQLQAMYPFCCWP